ncbi:hypothetical protein HanXRQr2_Chr09g0365181 [Helianthus annuus]|uniref:Uncharacterized protein n=1 Tax=Helianthus annuus TaxID=4232 RepID=A0A9K3I2E3_HELAN|nr:hypothetical protein HanXRQr2_Chr09g0365181 [Helianthus annuus]KAJ0891281.1 hypothetical protein HanPSC8_Chr09g0351871 [Helianthus annuus]
MKMFSVCSNGKRRGTDFSLSSLFMYFLYTMFCCDIFLFSY